MIYFHYNKLLTGTSMELDLSDFLRPLIENSSRGIGLVSVPLCHASYKLSPSLLSLGFQNKFISIIFSHLFVVPNCWLELHER